MKEASEAFSSGALRQLVVPTAFDLLVRLLAVESFWIESLRNPLPLCADLPDQHAHLIVLLRGPSK